jgi:hypothetical protein
MKKHKAKLETKKFSANNDDSSIESENPFPDESDEFEQEEIDMNNASSISSPMKRVF